MLLPKSRFCLQALALLVASLAAALAEGEPETSTIDYEIGHQLALEAFETVSPDHSYLLGDDEQGSPKVVTNEIMDIALEKIRELIIKGNMDRVEIPEFQHDFDKNLGFISLRGHFKGKEGWVESLLSIERAGDATLTVDGTSLVLDALLKLKKLDLGMKFEAELAGLTVKGNLKGHVTSNSVFLSHGLDYATGRCHLKLRSLEVKDLGKVYVEVSGLGDLDWLSSLIASWLTERANETIRNSINKVLFDILREEIKNADGCPHLALHT